MNEPKPAREQLPTETALVYPPRRDLLPDFLSEDHRYRSRFASSAEDLLRIQRLRFEVFNLELGEGLRESHETGLDSDQFDPQCHHLLVESIEDGAIIGTYRMQTSEMASDGLGFYAAGEFELSTLPGPLLASSVETGRACIHAEHRHHGVLLLLWKALGQYALHNQKRYIFGCCSLTSQDESLGGRAFEYLRREGHLHSELQLAAQPSHVCHYDQREASANWASVELPQLFRTYLRYGLKIVGEPAIDRTFQTIDFLALLDLHELEPAAILRQFEFDLREGR